MLQNLPKLNSAKFVLCQILLASLSGFFSNSIAFDWNANLFARCAHSECRAQVSQLAASLARTVELLLAQTQLNLQLVNF